MPPTVDRPHAEGGIERAGGLDPSLRRVEDWELWARFADLYDVAVITEVLVDREREAQPTDELHWYGVLVGTPGATAAALRAGARIRPVHMLVEAHLLAREAEGVRRLWPP